MKRFICTQIFIFFVTIFCTFLKNTYGQFIPTTPSTPTSSVDKQSLEISNDLFNGKVNITLPIYQYDFEGISFPISLNYSGGNGIRPDELPSWVGSGWNLTAGGYIHRTVRGKPDEALDFESDIYYYPNGQNGNSSPLTKIKTELKGDYSYFTNYDKLNVSNWYTGSYAATLSPSITNAPISFDYGNYTVTSYNHHPTYDLSPDEFSFSFGNINGKFYLNHLNKWIVTCSDGKNYDINVVTGEQEDINYTYQIAGNWFKAFYITPRIIKYFTITSDDGIKYYFGNTDVNASLTNQYFEFSYASSVIPVYPQTPILVPPNRWLSGFDGATFTELVPHTWHLTKIENLKTSSVITLSYKQDGLQVSKTSQAWGSGGTNTTSDYVIYKNIGTYNFSSHNNTFVRLSPISKIITPVWTLTSINFPDNIVINFNVLCY